MLDNNDFSTPGSNVILGFLFLNILISALPYRICANNSTI